MNATKTEDIAAGVGLTAVMVAAARAIATSRPDSLAKDDYAERFVSAVPTSVEIPTAFDQVPDGDGDPLWGRFSRFFDLRTRVFDDFVLECLSGGLRQFVVLGAGLDSRALRLDVPDDCAVYELDLPHVLAFKRRVLDEIGARSRVSHHFIDADLCEDWTTKLRAAGFDQEQPAIWLAEGLLPYLSPATEKNLLGGIDSMSVPGSGFCYEIIPNHQPHSPSATTWVEVEARLGLDIASLFNTEARPDSYDELTSMGWIGSKLPTSEYNRRHGRAQEPRDVFEKFHWTVVRKGGGEVGQ